MKYQIGELVVFLHGFKSGNIATIGTVVSTRPIKDLPNAIAYTIHHPWVDMSYEYSEDHLNNTSVSGKEYEERYGQQIQDRK